jgi:(2R)-3-sulfolactate dehydrogenase (NADP+)
VIVTETVTLSLSEATALCERAAIAAGASPIVAASLAGSVVAAEADGQPTVGLSHFIDYLDALAAGRIDGKAVPDITSPAPAVILSDARGGAAHPGFDAAFESLVAVAQRFGIAMFTQRNAFTCGSLSYFVGRLVERGLASLAATNGPALVAGAGSTRPVYCTNPMAFAMPVADAPPLIIDQSSSATAFVNIRAAAEAGKKIPEGWALDAEGRPTTDPNAAMQGALLAFGGNRGANVALMAELLAAGFNGAGWSLDAPPFGVGSRGPGTGMTVIAIAPRLIDPGAEARLGAYLSRLADDYGVHIPGRAKAEARARSQRDGRAVRAAVHDRIAAVAASRR